ncbi:EthD family reductase [Spirillospora sp. CA-128828]|uniref:EthD family reductase n=1 Tax=Spirillospora sp. CA-128828 TaxID=3240033 RepID=UPI003D94DDD0
MTATVNPAVRQMARFVVIYDTPSDVEAFERHYDDVHIPLAKQYPGLRRYTRSHKPAAVVGEPCHMVLQLDEI